MLGMEPVEEHRSVSLSSLAVARILKIAISADTALSWELVGAPTRFRRNTAHNIVAN